jgi:hypothetical protein
MPSSLTKGTSRSGPLTGWCSASAKLVMRVRFSSPAPIRKPWSGHDHYVRTSAGQLVIMLRVIYLAGASSLFSSPCCPRSVAACASSSRQPADSRRKSSWNFMVAAEMRCSLQILLQTPVTYFRKIRCRDRSFFGCPAAPLRVGQRGRESTDFPFACRIGMARDTRCRLRFQSRRKRGNPSLGWARAP